MDNWNPVYISLGIFMCIMCAADVVSYTHPPKLVHYDPMKFSTLGIPVSMLGLSPMASPVSASEVGEGRADLGLEREAALSGGTRRTAQ